MTNMNSLSASMYVCIVLLYILVIISYVLLIMFLHHNHTKCFMCFRSIHCDTDVLECFLQAYFSGDTETSFQRNFAIRAHSLASSNKAIGKLGAFIVLAAILAVELPPLTTDFMRLLLFVPTFDSFQFHLWLCVYIYKA